MKQSLLDQFIGMVQEEDYAYFASEESKFLIYIIELIDTRINDLEDNILGNQRKIKTTKAQQILLLKHLGMLEGIMKLDVTAENRARLLSILLNASFDNVKKDLQKINNEKDSELDIKSNYEFLVSTFNTIGLPEKADEMQKILDRIRQKKEKILKKEVTPRPTP
jgi:hypothetical protein